ncbi:hypothetical protein L6164_018060 [Bauhinia variegata]|nr:hypothetical protein L6164_018060 [Bauhinia variegata]
MLGCYCQPNNKPLFGSVLVAQDDSSITTLKEPRDYELAWSSECLQIKQENHGYIWLPTPHDGYKAVGFVVTTSQDKPSLDRIRCVRSDLTDQCEAYTWIWGPGKNNDTNGLNVYNVRPCKRGTQAAGVHVGTFLAQNGATTNTLSIACLINKNFETTLPSMPNVHQIQALIQAYSPYIYFHPDEQYLPSSVNWYFTNGALLYKKGEESKPVPIEPNGTNLPQDDNNDGAYWLDLPLHEAKRERVKKGDLQSCLSYVHVKSMFGGTFTDISMWVFFPFNGPARAKVWFINIPMGKIGEHVGDWEHVTLRISNFNGELRKVYLSQHSHGKWVDAPEIEFQNGNKPVTYSSLHGHAFYTKPGLSLQGRFGIGIRNDTAKSDKVMDMGERFEVVAGDYLGSAIVEPPWLHYARHWGPTIRYEANSALEWIGRLLPNEVLCEEGPTGPKKKINWCEDERVKC